MKRQLSKHRNGARNETQFEVRGRTSGQIFLVLTYLGIEQ
jgi:hypothetical protein